MQWQVSSMERTLTDGDLSDVVTTLHWQVADSDGDHSGRCYGTVGLEAPDEDNFTATQTFQKQMQLHGAKQP